MTSDRHRSGRVGLHVLAVLGVLVCLVAARWQWERAYRTVDDVLPDEPAVALADLDPRKTWAGMRISVTGQFDAAHQVLVAPRPRGGVAGGWVLTPLLPDEGGVAQPGAAVAIVRGWVPAGQSVPAPPPGRVSVVGVLVPDVREPGAQAPGEPPTLTQVDTGALAALAGYPVRSGWLALQRLDPPVAGQPLPLAVTDLPGANVGLSWRNAAYAVQWIVFAGFVVLFWSRFRRELDERPREQETLR
jgi:cytochrome oxidase assembly protein ShyY1